jgi:hypothetical protein
MLARIVRNSGILALTAADPDVGEIERRQTVRGVFAPDFVFLERSRIDQSAGEGFPNLPPAPHPAHIMNRKVLAFLAFLSLALVSLGAPAGQVPHNPVLNQIYLFFGTLKSWRCIRRQGALSLPIRVWQCRVPAWFLVCETLAIVGDVAYISALAHIAAKLHRRRHAFGAIPDPRRWFQPG